jgi:hypothetical protein
MRHPLERLLRLRTLLEDVSRVELEAHLQELAQVEGALTCLQETERTMRRQSFASIAEARRAQRLEAEALSEWAGHERGFLERTREKKAAEVDTAKAAYLERRMESRQAGSVIEAGHAVAEMEQGRREQRELDDWFGQRKQRGR